MTSKNSDVRLRETELRRRVERKDKPERGHRGISEEAVGNQTQEGSLIWQALNGTRQLACLGL